MNAIQYADMSTYNRLRLNRARHTWKTAELS